jgi:hypothetical protein
MSPRWLAGRRTSFSEEKAAKRLLLCSPATHAALNTHRRAAENKSLFASFSSEKEDSVSC